MGRNEMNENKAVILGLSPTSSAKVSLSLSLSLSAHRSNRIY